MCRFKVMIFGFLFLYSLSLVGQVSDTIDHIAEPTVAGDQNAAVRGWQSGVEISSAISFTGYNAALTYVGHYKNHSFFAGPKLVFSDANNLYDAPWGIHLGYRYFLPEWRRLSAFASVEYQSIFFRFNPAVTQRWNSIHELHASYGFKFTFNQHWYIGQSLGLGGYIERLFDPFDDRKDTFNGFSPQARIWFGYLW